MSKNYETVLAETFGLDLANAILSAEPTVTVVSIVGESSTVQEDYLQTKGGKPRTVGDLKNYIGYLLKNGSITTEQDSVIAPDLDVSETSGTINPADTFQPSIAATPVVEAPAFDVAKARLENGLPANWTDAEVAEFVRLDGVTYGTTRNQNFVIDPTRKNRELTKTEIIDAINGDFPDYTDNDTSDLVVALKQVEIVDPAWTDRNIVEYIRHTIVPAKAAEGVWLEDITRADRLADDWTDAELIAWLEQKIPAIGKSTDQSLAVAVKERFGYKGDGSADAVRAFHTQKTTTPVHVPLKPIGKAVQPHHDSAIQAPVVATEATTSEQAINIQATAKTGSHAPAELLKGLTLMNQSYIVDSLAIYDEQAKPGKIVNEKKGADLQQLLDDVIRYITNLKDPAGFASGMEILFQFVKARTAKGGHFNYDNVYRWTGFLRTQVRVSHIAFLNVLILLSSESELTRSQVDISTYIGGFPAHVQPFLMEYLSSKL